MEATFKEGRDYYRVIEPVVVVMVVVVEVMVMKGSAYLARIVTKHGLASPRLLFQLNDSVFVSVKKTLSSLRPKGKAVCG
jgi:hypothetical protein